MITAEMIREARALCEAATKNVEKTIDEPFGLHDGTGRSLLMLDVDGMACVDNPADARLWAASRPIMLALLDEVERLRAELSASQRRTRIYTCPVVDADGRTCGEIVAEAGHGCGECLEAMGATATAMRNPKSACACAPPPARHLPDCPHFTPEAP